MNENFAEDMTKNLEKNFFADKQAASYKEIWRFKTKLICGKEDPEGI